MLRAMAFDLKPLAEFIGKRMSKQELVELIYYCPFNLNAERLGIDDNLSNIVLHLEDNYSSDDHSEASTVYSVLKKRKILFDLPPEAQHIPEEDERPVFIESKLIVPPLMPTAPARQPSAKKANEEDKQAAVILKRAKGDSTVETEVK